MSLHSLRDFADSTIIRAASTCNLSYPAAILMGVYTCVAQGLAHTAIVSCKTYVWGARMILRG